ncbi:hypothetical protein [Archangium sp.]|uniref:hypothetical protein n=1 Tax=Archangium sp. TaxID=1872627 RepID=UPI00389B2B6C
MLWPLVETLSHVEPFVPAALVPTEALAQARRLGARLPDAMSSYYFECRLAGNSTQVDLLTCTTAADGRQLLASQAGAAGMGESPSASLLNSIRGFCSRWANPASALSGQIPLVWFEFDDVARPTLDQANLGFCLEPDYLSPEWPRAAPERLDEQTFHQLVEEPLQLLLGHSVPGPLRQSLRTTFACLPEEGRIIDVSVMLARRPAVVKLYASVPLGTLLPYLASIGWTGDESVVLHILSSFCEPLLPQRVFIDLTLGETLSPRLGVAFPRLHLDRHQHGEQRWRQLLELCVRQGLCTPEKQAALMTWKGSSRCLYADEAWPVRMNRWADVKLVHQPGSPLEAKAYLGFTPRFSIL